MLLKLPSKKSNGGKRLKRPKNGTRRRSRQEARNAQNKLIEAMIAKRSDRVLGLQR